jgi:hypothetical protein
MDERRLRSTRPKLAKLRPFSGTAPLEFLKISDFASDTIELAEALVVSGAKTIIGDGIQ